MTAKLYYFIEINKKFSTAYYPQGNGSCEKSMVTLGLGLFSLASNKRATWCEFVRGIMCGHNAAKSAATNISPHEMIFGYPFIIPEVVAFGIPERKLEADDQLYHQELVERIKCIKEKAEIFEEQYRQKYKAKHDEGRSPHNFKVGDQVFLKAPRNRFGYTKAQNRWTGPYSISESTDTNVTLHDNQGKLVAKTNINRIKKAYERSNVRFCDIQEEIENDPIYEVDLRTARRARPLNPEIEENKDQRTEPSSNGKEPTLDGNTTQSKTATHPTKWPTKDGDEITSHKYQQGKLIYRIRSINGQTIWLQENEIEQELLENYGIHQTDWKRYSLRQRTYGFGIHVPTYIWYLIVLGTIMHSCQGREKICQPIGTWGNKKPCKNTSPTA
jgi:hypothetical protein